MNLQKNNIVMIQIRKKLFSNMNYDIFRTKMNLETKDKLKKK